MPTKIYLYSDAKGKRNGIWCSWMKKKMFLLFSLKWSWIDIISLRCFRMKTRKTGVGAINWRIYCTDLCLLVLIRLNDDFEFSAFLCQFFCFYFQEWKAILRGYFKSCFFNAFCSTSARLTKFKNKYRRLEACFVYVVCSMYLRTFKTR